MPKILVVDDDQAMAMAVQKWLSLENHEVEVVFTGTDAKDRLKFYWYDLVVLDWHLPDADGIEILAGFRAAGGTTPVVVLTGKKRIEEKESGFGAGADDYLTEPFELRELSLRIAALLRRQFVSSGSILQAGNLSLDTKTHKAYLEGQELALQPKEFALLEFFMRHPGQVFDAQSLVNHVWSSYSDVSPECIRAYIYRLRACVDAPGRTSCIRTVHGVGYCFETTKND